MALHIIIIGESEASETYTGDVSRDIYIVRVSFMSFDLLRGHAHNSVVLLYSRACAP